MGTLSDVNKAEDPIDCVDLCREGIELIDDVYTSMLRFEASLPWASASKDI